MKKPKRQAKAVAPSKKGDGTDRTNRTDRSKRARLPKSAKPTTIPRLDGAVGKPNDVSWHDRFLLSLRHGSTVTTACLVGGVKRDVAYDHREKFPVFAKDWDLARATGRRMKADAIEESFLDRVENGTPAFTGSGEPILDPKTHKQVREYNETAVLRSLAALRPEVWSEKHKVEFSGKVTMTAEEELEASRETRKSLLLTLAGGLSGRKAD